MGLKHYLVSFIHPIFVFAVVQSLSRVWLFATPQTAAHQASLPFTISQSLLKLMSIELMMPSNHPILCLPLLLLPSIFPSIKGLFQWVGSLHQMAKYWSFSFSTSTSNEYSGLISFRIDCFSLQSKGLWKDSSSEPPFERINSLALRFLSGPPLTSTHDYQKNQLWVSRSLLAKWCLWLWICWLCLS